MSSAEASRADGSRADGSRARELIGDRGSATAEFAVAMPAVLLVLALSLGATQLAGLQLRVQDAAADAARLLARGESAAPAVSRVGAVMSSSRQGSLICVELTAAPVGPAAMLGLRAEASSCALAGGL